MYLLSKLPTSNPVILKKQNVRKLWNNFLIMSLKKIYITLFFNLLVN